MQRFAPEYLKYEKRCSKGDDLLKGTGTQEMLKSILHLCTGDSPVFPDIKRVIFHDVSSFECNDMQISLSIYYLLLYGSTWYEDKFGAKFIDKTKRTNIAKFKSLLSLSGKAQKTTFGSQKPKKNIFSFYDETNSNNTDNWHEYFKYLKDTSGCKFMMTYKNEIESVANKGFLR